MGYLDNKSITVDAIITKKGREKLAKGDFSIVKFALADDEIDYTTLWDENHPRGSEFYGSAIENMPLLEASPDENQAMKYNLVTLPKATSRLPIITATPANIIFVRQGEQAIIVPNTANGINNTYTATLHSSSAVSISGQEVNSSSLSKRVPPPSFSDMEELQPDMFPLTPYPNAPFPNTSFPEIPNPGASQTAIGTRFLVTALNNPFKIVTTQVSITGNDTGGSVTVFIVVNAQAQ